MTNHLFQEHHLQEILSAVHRNNISNRTPRGSSEKPSAPTQAAFIPTPDSTGVVDNYDKHYSPKAWKDPSSYISTSQTVEEHIAGGIANGFTYYMDERDKEWLDKNNEQARGEGTSAQGALSSPVTRTSARSLKAKGKEPETLQPVVISEDEFELVMGVFEKVTHERTAYLHHVCVVVLQVQCKLIYVGLYRVLRLAWTFQHFRNIKMYSPLRYLPRCSRHIMFLPGYPYQRPCSRSRKRSMGTGRNGN